MTEQETIDQLKAAGLQMYTALTVLNALHHEEEVTEEDKTYIVCAHCSALADAFVQYPCPTVEVLLNDVEVPTETSEPAESE